MQTIYQGKSADFTFKRVVDIDGNPVDLTGLSLNIIVKIHPSDPDSSALLTKAILLSNNLDSKGGLPKISITETESNSIPFGFFHLGVVIIHPNGSIISEEIDYLTVSQPGDVIDSPVVVADTQAPVITLLGQAAFNLEYGAVYADAGATAFDNIGGDITANIVTVNNIDTNTIGPQTVTYDVSDLAGNPAIQVVRSVTVVDTVAPVITLTGGDLTLNLNDTYTELGATVTDNVDTGLTVTITGVVDTSTSGVYTRFYDAVDLSGNNAPQLTRTVTVQQLLLSMEFETGVAVEFVSGIYAEF